ncbi:MAG TPA: class I SAM-dependent methyltransferase [Thermoanaerobaculia bacterium]|nr:class I SAM-dependent methyltransferase [Thermoanaerobaculia bacterium]
MEEKIRSVLRRPDEALLADVRRREWTGHNIPLTETESTLGRERGLIGDDPRTLTIKQLIRRFGPSNRPIRILDLGSLEGGLSFEMAREGWDVIGIEGRAENLEKADLIRRYFALENLRFELRDVKTLSRQRDGRFDAVLCCGLLYHLDDPFDFLRTLREITSDDGLLFVDTHVAPDEAAQRHATYAGQLSEMVTITAGGQSYDGSWFAEPSEGSILDRQWSAISNPRSFWPTRRSLIRAAYHAGYHGILELFGMFEIDGEFALRDQYSRLYLACLPRL